MNNKEIREKVKESFSWKKNSAICAKRVGISLSKYLRIKQELKTESKNLKRAKQGRTESFNLEKGEGTISTLAANEPKNPKEIIKLLKIDTSKWKLSQYWNKQMGDHWRVSALVSKLKESEQSHIEELLKKWKPKGYSLSPDRDQVCGIMSLQDIHFGKEGNETIDKDFEDTVMDLIKRGTASHNIENLYFVVGGDLINMDTFSGTTTSGTPLDNCSTATEAYIQAFDAMHWAIQLIMQHVGHLTVVYIPGNHDRLSSFHLVHALSKSISDHPNITWDIEYAERKVHVWHDNFNAFEHGDATSKNTAVVYATEFANEWGSTTNRTLFTGHFHQNKKIEYITTSETAGFIHKTLPSLSKTDYYHYHKKYVGNRRSGKLELQSPTKGNICELTYLAD